MYTSYSYKGHMLFDTDGKLSIANDLDAIAFIKLPSESKINFYIFNCSPHVTDSELYELTSNISIISDFYYNKSIVKLFFHIINKFFNNKNKEMQNLFKSVSSNVRDGKKIIYENENYRFLNADDLKFNFPYPIDHFLKINDDIIMYTGDSILKMKVISKSVTSFSSYNHEFICYKLIDESNKIEKFVYVDDLLKINEINKIPMENKKNVNYFAPSIVKFIEDKLKQ